MKFRIGALASLLVLPLRLAALDVQYLVPLNATAVPGAGGTQWQTELTVFNTGTGDVHLKAPVCQHMQPVPCDDEVTLAAGKARTLQLVPQIAGGGAFVYFEETDGQPMQLRVHDISVDDKGWGAEIPVVPASDFGRDLVLVDVPNDPRYRATLRLYSPFDHVAARVRVYPLFGDTPIEEQTHTLTNPQQSGSYVFTPLHPAYRQIDPLSPAVRASGQTRLRLHIHFQQSTGPIFFAPRGWAFVSLTNNDTQQVTVITPQRYSGVPGDLF